MDRETQEATSNLEQTANPEELAREADTEFGEEPEHELNDQIPSSRPASHLEI